MFTWNVEYYKSTKNGPENASENSDIERKNFFAELRDTLKEDARAVYDADHIARHEELVTQYTRSLQDTGPRQFYSHYNSQRRGWYYYDRGDDQWRREPSENEKFYEQRKLHW